ncbi:MAG: ATP synthase F1 subunit gamma [Verrucomicrobiota bacterium]|nr:ATP synthase F1 subunit gamma [Verrucomicrobiota bacterium]
MPNTRDIRRRIRSVKNTAQLTKAMQMVASSKMRKAQEAALAGRPYASLLTRVLAEVSQHTGDFVHPLMEIKPVRRRAIVIVSTDRGLCGALNANLFREAAKTDPANTVFIAAGRKGAQFVARTRRHLAAEFSYRDTPSFSEARAISNFARDLFLKGEVDEVEVLYNNFISTVTQKPQYAPFLPVGQLTGLTGDIAGESSAAPLAAGTTEFLFEPGPADVLGSLLPHYLNFLMYQFLLEAKASEHSARMVAMKNATDNANELIRDLTLEYNKLRQAIITKELLEITTAAASVTS